MQKQPDFRGLFLKHFGDTPRKVTYEVRPDSNMIHDVEFMSSLVHDARLRLQSVRLHGKRLTIPIERDCWELPNPFRSDLVKEFYTASALLTIQPVLEVEWSYQSYQPPSPEDELDIWYIWLDYPARQYVEDDDRLPVIVAGSGWDCIAIVSLYKMKIRIQDLKVPSLLSERKKAKRRGRSGE